MADGEVRALEPEERERVAAAEWAICVATFYGDLAERLTNGAFEGFWQTSEVNPFLRWADLDFEVPAALTQEQAMREIEIDARESPAPWTAFEYVACRRLE